MQESRYDFFVRTLRKYYERKQRKVGDECEVGAKETSALKFSTEAAEAKEIQPAPQSPPLSKSA
ncbi:hypothetical protein [aff. Roholtiella sp. LEGE 12411]|jgi:hypothetical protein|uniref:hypothetical protein n=1 Tax=aff. Roholtiella sp. LEGE 12411 TaxID=1828822 RepID=UPI001882379A|nr:hypothetical protein [aff. Roholtiella sp. LEGE 12411]MBE9037649.1 hypothetical protein [aff. Roholtiella sp. LEGE 12411]